MNATSLPSLEVFLSEAFPDIGATLSSLIQANVVDPLRKEIFDCRQAIKTLQNQVVVQQEQILALTKEKKLTDEILLNLKVEVSILKDRAVSVTVPVSLADSLVDSSMLAPIASSEKGVTPASHPGKQAAVKAPPTKW